MNDDEVIANFDDSDYDVIVLMKYIFGWYSYADKNQEI